MVKIAALLTCHNRRPKTLACLAALFQCRLPDGYSLEVFIVDDGSTDGTDMAVRERYPQVNIIKGDGNLYWNGGMRVAFATAMQKEFDYYLWLNDDTILHSHALETLLSTEQQFAVENKPALIVGSAQAELGGRATYGGQSRIGKWNYIKYRLVEPADIAVPCDTMNGNCVLIPRKVAQKIGNLDSRFIHTIGDLDYGLRARKAGFQVVVMPGYAGLCCRNSIENSYADTNLKLLERFRRLNGKKGLPLHAWYIFTKRHCGVFWFVFWLWPYLSIVKTINWNVSAEQKKK